MKLNAQALAINPGEIGALFAFADAYYVGGQYEESLCGYAKIAKVAPARVSRQLAWSFWALRRYDEAKQQFEEDYKQHPSAVFPEPIRAINAFLSGHDKPDAPKNDDERYLEVGVFELMQLDHVDLHNSKDAEMRVGAVLSIIPDRFSRVPVKEPYLILLKKIGRIYPDVLKTHLANESRPAALELLEQAVGDLATELPAESPQWNSGASQGNE